MARKRGTKRPVDPIELIVENYIVGPVIVVFGMIVVGSLLDAAIGTNGVFKVLLPAAGGIGAIGAYFGRYWHRERND